MASITAATCEYGLAKSREGCVTTLAQLCGGAYNAAQVGYFVAGVLALGVSGYKLACALRCQGAMLQKQIFALCMFASFTMLARGVDPGSYGHYVPRPLSGFFADSCTATLYTIFIKTVIFYISITQHGVVEKHRTIVIFERSTIMFIWMFYIAYDVSLLQDKGFGGMRDPVQLYVSAGFLLFLSAGFLVFGLQVIRRLESIETMNTHRLVVTAVARPDTNREAVDFSSVEAHAVLEEVKRKPRKPADRIRLLLTVTETVAVLSVAAQVYVAVVRGRSPPLELECANGVHCEKIAMTLNPLHVFQYIWVWVALWTYWRTQQRAESKASESSSRRKTPFGAEQA
ncbi:hypothetical protein PybrP1_004740 [[Pythium] brassicae (nom. inval.)]|nr:hypothetical protein PybrP1_004740 [[Pythium] brassicae (nom. inval.)]